MRIHSHLIEEGYLPCGRFYYVLVDTRLARPPRFSSEPAIIGRVCACSRSIRRGFVAVYLSNPRAFPYLELHRWTGRKLANDENNWPPSRYKPYKHSHLDSMLVSEAKRKQREVNLKIAADRAMRERKRQERYRHDG
jgi:hypothetical protein